MNSFSDVLFEPSIQSYDCQVLTWNLSCALRGGLNWRVEFKLAETSITA